MRPLLACLAALLCFAPAAQARYVLVATGGSTVALIDTRSNAPTASPELPGATRAVAAAPDGSRGYVAAGRGIAMIDLTSGKVIGGVPLQGVPAAIAVAPDGQRLYSARKSGIEIIDPLGIKHVATLTLSGMPLDLVVTGSRAVVVQAGGKVAILDLTTGHLVRRVKVAGASAVGIDNAGHAWISATEPGVKKHKPAARLVRINPDSGRFAGSVKLGTDGGGGVGVSPDGTRAIVAPGGHLKGIHRKAALVDLTKRRVIARPPTGGGPGRAAYAPDAARLYISDATAKTVSVLSAFSAKRLKTIHMSGTPGAVVVQPGLALVTGTEGDDVLNGTRGPDRLVGLGGNDLLRGMRGDDVLEGGLGQRHPLGLERQRRARRRRR